jgi:thioredoxin-like negative regulator of GroEL
METVMMTLAQGPAHDSSDDAASRKASIEAIYATGHWLLASERIAEAARVFRLMLKAAPHDERGWLGLGECHERIEQPRIAAELYGAGSIAAADDGTTSVRCLVARARTLSKLGADVTETLEAAIRAAADAGDDELVALVADERRRLS